ncbi:MAG: hypothetical protein COX14_01595 [Chloroflexi bacterium CG23_combo_of_CG06-09_8_20_14_all_45_10]|nr:MAG: hypothetical protein COX14_01595 [Chloroflexi bacterium CG23_combo_of_CG06-09_8_20_14_all_45_10]
MTGSEGLKITRPQAKLKSFSEERGVNSMAKIDKFSFGSIIIDGKKYSRDVLILADGMITKRKGGFLMFGSHNIRKEEIKELAEDRPEAVIIGTGTNGKASVAPEVEGWAKEKNLKLIVQPSYQAATRLNELTEQGKRVAALIHITC